MKALTVELDLLQSNEWTPKEQENVALVTDFVQHLMNEHDFEYIDRQFGHHNYTQHNRNMNDTIAGVVEMVSGLVKRFPDYTYDVKHIHADGDYVMFHSHVTMNKTDRGNDKKGFNIMDTWKIQGGQIVEHWDAIQALDRSMRFFVFMNGGKIRNDNGVF
ncbi:MAG: nuclear transport factor 2 family protein [Bacteroidota bacterium]